MFRQPKTVHINVPFEEPLYNFQEKPTVSISSLLKKTHEKEKLYD